MKLFNKQSNKIQISVGERIFNICNNVIMFFIMIVMAYPIWHVIIASISDGSKLMAHSGLLLKPIGFSLESYKMMSLNPMILRSYINTIYIVVVSTLLSVIVTAIAAYFLSRKYALWPKYMMMLIVFTMFFSGGMIPSYLINTQVFHMRDSYMAIILPGLINTYNLIIMRTSFEAVPESLFEAARIDGAGHWKSLFTIGIPLVKASVAVMVLYYAVDQWNSWFQASIYLTTREKFPLQLILREILINNDTNSMTVGTIDSETSSISETIKYAVIVVSTVPILCVYPFLQKYFAKGALIGAVKG